MYFYAPYTGFYTFYFHNVDDGCMAFLGNGAFACCNSDDVSGGNDGNALLYANYNVDTGPTGNTAQVYLEGNIFYPLKIVYINVGNVGTFGFGIQDSNNQNLALQNYLFRLPGSVSEGQCTQASLELPKTSTTEICINCQRPSTTTYITYISQSSLTYPVPQEVIEVSAPPQTTIRSTVACLTCTATYSFTTGGFVTSGTTSIPGKIIYVSVPVSTITTTVPCTTCTGPVTLITETVITTGTAPETVVEIIVSTPMSTMSTTVPCTTCTGPVTLITETVITTGTAPETVVEIIVSTPIDRDHHRHST
ncbi:hypothetical protein B5S31_g1849 [[Candida] boidinii]|nr:hypothetical protein B5S31_g1849 [[Candida] boidinii]